ncbi:MAG TPA: hypothetical protein VLA03_10750, partial [Draconibacterium sp.]|nr:hypothetical protein [Draconibacterium sp.]
KQYRLVKSIFEQVSTFSDSTFYDISTWNFPYTFGVAFSEIGSLKELEYSGPEDLLVYEGKIIGGKNSTAYLFEWNEYTSPKALYEFQKAGLRTKVATKNFAFEIEGELKEFSYGTILIEVSNQYLNEIQIYNLAQKISGETGIDIYGLSTGLSKQGIDLGSNSFVSLNKPDVLVFVAGNIRSTDAGEIWHLFDQRYNIPVTLVETNSLNSVELSKYNTIILPSGSYQEWNSNDVQKIKNWTQEGGILIACQRAAAWAAQKNIGATTFKKTAQADSSLNFNYASREKERNLNAISGAIFNTIIDNTHPLCYGYTENFIPVFKSGNTTANTMGINYAEPVKFAPDPYLSGFVSGQNLDKIKNAPVVSVQNIGSGKIISFHENMTFRGIWLGTNKLLANGVFFGSVIR